uniref:Lipase_3 domain-containing protein n=1 Tax=Parastrongyloides trichosuri TaxID=131310 RepID=A0A0N4ZVX3_PARTI
MYLLFLLSIPVCLGYKYSFTTDFLVEEAEIMEAVSVYVPTSKYGTGNLCDKTNAGRCLCNHFSGYRKALGDGFNIITYNSSDHEILYVVFTYDKNPSRLLEEYMKPSPTKNNFYDATGVFKHQIDIMNKGRTFIDGILYKICLSGEYKNAVFAGHSVAGGVAALLAYECVHKGYCKRDQTKVYTFGSPRTGNCHFAKKYDEKVPYTYRVVVRGDPLTGLPQRHCIPGYGKCDDCTEDKVDFHHHFGQEIYYQKNITGKPRYCKKFTEDRKCNVNRIPSPLRRKQVEDAYARNFHLKYYRNTFEDSFIQNARCPYM